MDELTVVERSLVARARGRRPCSSSTSCAASRPTRATSTSTPSVSRYAVGLANVTREPEKYGLAELEPYIAFGASPRGSINLVHAARALAVVRGRRYVLPTDVHELAKDVLRHRLVLTYQALAEERTPDAILDDVLAAAAAAADRPRPRDRGGDGVTQPRRSSTAAGRCPPARCARSTSSCAAASRACSRASTARRRAGAGRSSPRCGPTSRATTSGMMDWNATARTGQPHVRVEVAERALTTWLVFDTSPSMGFGTADRLKSEVAMGVALAVGQLATRRGNRLGIVTFGDPGAIARPPRQGRAGLLGVLGELGREPAEGYVGATSLGEGLGRTARLAHSRSLVVCVSDFRGPRDWRGPLLEVAGRHDVVAVEIRDRREQELPDVGDLWLVDPETGRQLRVDTGRRRIRSRFAEAAAAERAEVEAVLRAAGADHVVLDTDGDWLRPLALFMRRRRGARALPGGPNAIAVAR